jgi:demethylmenaquinone methyltransferase/2-methoxy-6-polyprenyl-1,4-benzoquinol methylase
VTKSLSERIATPEGKRRHVRTLFATIADRYDLTTVLLSYGRDRVWKRRLVDRAAPPPGSRVLDLATGTGDLAFGLSGTDVRVVGLDITPRMIQLARARRSGDRSPLFLIGDMQALPFASGSFDLVTTGYGLRNVPDLQGALDEIVRVLRPGGRFWALDFNRPSNSLVRTAYLAYLTTVGSVLGWLLHRDPDTYRYIPASIRTYPGAPAVSRMMRACGFREATYYPVLGGLMAMHGGSKAMKNEE